MLLLFHLQEVDNSLARALDIEACGEGCDNPTNKAGEENGTTLIQNGG